MRKIVVFLFSCFLSLAFSCSSKIDSTEKRDSVVALPNNETTINGGVVAKKDSSFPMSIEKSGLLSGITFKGDFKEAWTWKDLNGVNFLILSSNLKIKKGNEDFDDEKTQELFAKHFIVSKENLKPELLWEMYDLEKDCIFDLVSEFMISPIITDLDNNGIKESFLVYKLACRSDVSPARMKIVVHENKNKFALRGSMYIKMNIEEDKISAENWEPNLTKINAKESDYSANWGRYENELEFEKAPKAFLEKAKSLWLENFIEN